MLSCDETSGDSTADSGTSPSGSAGILRRLKDAGLRPRKSLGQHILHDPAILEAIVAASGVGPNDTVLEIGTGPGTLTRFLCARAGQVISVEVDPRMAAFARAELVGVENLEIIEADVLLGKGTLNPVVFAPLSQFERLHLVANLPYNIATPLLLHVFAELAAVTEAVVLVQRELALRLRAQPGTREYGVPGLLLGFWAEVEFLKEIAPGSFHPPPKVRSRLIRIRRKAEPLAEPALYDPFRRWVRTLFGQRRKQLGGVLARILGRDHVSRVLEAIEVSPSTRIEALSGAAFIGLARRLQDGPIRNDRFSDPPVSE